MKKNEFKKNNLKNIVKKENKDIKNRENQSFEIINSLNNQISKVDKYLNRLIFQKDVSKAELLRLRDIHHGHDEKSVVSANEVFGKRNIK